MPIPPGAQSNRWTADDPCVLGVYQPSVGGASRVVSAGAAQSWWAWEGPPTSRLRLDLQVLSSHAPGGLVLQIELWSRVSATSWQGARVVQAAWTPATTPWAQFVFQFSGVITPVWDLWLGSNFQDTLVLPRVTLERVSSGAETILGDDVV